ncbi:MAG TPA: response regulator [Candidatus Hydrogenedentes bacterium]|nr:response regulator [Candidatus Hydrogenedentota bacterium]HPU98716.1 response regulator [Candidatus Hydrogenedentota bacterium]
MAYKILVVDDEPDVVALLETTLKAEGFDVVTAYDGITALDVCNTEKPDLVLLDIMMPMMSGYEVCEQIKANPLTQHIPVLCISSAHSPEARSHCFRVGAVELLKKPFLPAELVAQVKRHLKDSGKPVL